MSDFPTIDDYPLDQVVRALRQFSIAPKAKMMLVAQAGAESRALSPWDMTRVVGSNHVSAFNSAYGNFAKQLTLKIDPSLKPVFDRKQGGGSYYVNFLIFAKERWTHPLEGEGSAWVFVMRENLARALANAGIAPYVPLSIAVADRTDRDEDTDEAIADFPFAGDTDDGGSNALFDIENAKQELATVSETVREQVIQARIGQGVFRHKLLAHWEGMCAVTGIAVPQTLVASHIKPWRASSNADRLDQFNGLLLVGTLDRLFDSGLVSFSDSGGMLVSE